MARRTAAATAILFVLQWIGKSKIAAETPQRKELQQTDDPMLRRKSYLAVSAYGAVTDAMEEVFTYYARELRGLVEFWVIYDSTCREQSPDNVYVHDQAVPARQCSDNSVSRRHTARLREIADRESFRAFKYSDRQLEKRYRLMRSLQATVFDNEEPAYTNAYFGITFWVRFLIAKGYADERTMGYIWTVENDNLYAGHVSEFLKSVIADPSANGVHYLAQKVIPAPSWWDHLHTNTWPMAHEHAWIADEFIMRFSPRLLLTIEQMLLLNVVMYGEAFAATICHAVDWCRAANFSSVAAWELERPGQGPSDCWYEWNCRITQEQFTGYLTDPARKDQWYHANKWLYMPDARDVYAALE